MSRYIIKVDTPTAFLVGESYKTFTGSTLDGGFFTVKAIDIPSKRLTVETTTGWVPVNTRNITYATTSLQPGNSFQLEAVSLRVGNKTGVGKLPTTRRIGHSVAENPFPGPQPPANPLFWYKADVGIVLDASNRVRWWYDQTPNHFDMQPQNNTTGLNPVSFWPTFKTNVINGLPAVRFSNAIDTATGQYLEFNGAIGTHLPSPDGAPVQVLALLKPTDPNMGLVCTLRLDLDDLEMGCRHSFGSDIYLASSLDHNGLVTQSLQTNRNGQTLVMDWEYFGAPDYRGAAHVNGTAQHLTPINGNEPLVQYNSTSGFTLGNMAAGSNGFLNAEMVECIGYLGTDPTTLVDARTYLMKRAGLL